MITDERLAAELLKVFLTNPLSCVADDAYGSLLVQLMQESTQEWEQLRSRSVAVHSDHDLGWSEDRGPYLVTLTHSWPGNLNRLDPAVARTLKAAGCWRSCR